MPFNKKIEADYIELINHQLDNLPVEKVEEFDLIRDLLQSIDKESLGLFIHEKFISYIDSIKHFLKNPDLFVEFSDDYDAFKRIVEQRIAQKIEELSKLSELEKQKYIDNSNAKQANNKCYLEKIKNLRPNLYSHINFFSSEPVVNYLNFTLEESNEHLKTLLTKYEVVLESEDLDDLMNVSTEIFHIYYRSGISIPFPQFINDIISIKEQFIENSVGFMKLANDAQIPWNRLLDISSPNLTLLLAEPLDVIDIMRNSEVSFEDLISFSFSDLANVLTAPNPAEAAKDIYDINLAHFNASLNL